MQVSATLRPIIMDIFGTDDHLARYGHLTNAHAASSFCQPVLIIEGQVYGPADIPAGYEIALHFSRLAPSSDIYETDGQIRAERDHEQVEMAQRAKHLGYAIANTL